MNKLQRAEEFLEKLKGGMTFREIGLDYNLNKMTIHTELYKYFPNETKNIIEMRSWYVGNRKEAKEPNIFICKFCGKEVKSNYRYYTPKFCSKKCHSAFMKKAFNN